MTTTDVVAQQLITRGWAPIPLPPRAKTPPPSGLTGYGGRYLTALDPAYDWTGNLALRMWPETVGIDLDAYAGGVAGLAELAAKFGTLPRTWCTSSGRGDRSGIYLYQIPAGCTFVTDPATGVDVVQAHHRYALVAPSTHPEGRPYGWTEPNGEPADLPPSPSELPWLPTRWIDGLASSSPKLSAAHAARPEVVQAFVDTHVGTLNAAALRGVLTALERVEVGGRHDGLVTALCWAMREAAAGWYPADTAIAHVWDWWQAIMSSDPRRRNGGEFDGAVRWAVAQVQADPERIDRLRHVLERPGEEPPEPVDELPLPLYDWSDEGPGDVELIRGLVMGGRWTQVIASAKQGKSTFVAVATLHAAHGLDPFDGTPTVPVSTIWVNGEMGQSDLRDIIENAGYDPRELTTWLAAPAEDLRLDTPAGAERLLATVERTGAQVVVLDGLNSFLSPGRAEKDDDGWRSMFRLTIAPLKTRGVGVVSTDNLGKDTAKGSRGSSVKNDKADVVIALTQLGGGVRLQATHRRTDQYLTDLVLNVEGLGGESSTVYRQAGGVPPGTAECVQALDRLGVPLDSSRRAAQKLLHEQRDRAKGQHQDVHVWQFRNEVVGHALQVRKQAANGGPRALGTTLDQLLGPAAGTTPGATP